MRIHSTSPGAWERRGFSLIELMVVIAVIAFLATLIAALAPGIRDKRIRSEAQAMIAKLTLAIDGYRDKFGFYPPENANAGGTNRPPLYYSLKGAVRQDDGTYEMLDGNVVTSQSLNQAFGLEGILNAGATRQEAKDFLPGLTPDLVRPDPASVEAVHYLVFPRKGPDGDFNPVHYDASSPARHNLESYDVWIEVELRGKKVIIGNWRY